MKSLLLIVFLSMAAYGIGGSDRSINVEVITSDKSNQNITITPTGSGDVVLKNYSGVLKSSSGTLSASDVNLTSEVTGTLPVANGGTGSAAQNFVDLTTNQATIAGTKTFTGKLVTSTTSNGSVPCPVMTNTQMTAIGSPTAGDCVYNSTNAATYVYTTSWQSLLSSGGVETCKIETIKDNNTDGGGVTSGAYRTIEFDDSSTGGCSFFTAGSTTADTDFDSNAKFDEFSLASGTYIATACQVVRTVGRSKVRLRNTSDSTTAIQGMTDFITTTSSTGGRACLKGVFTIASSKTFELQIRVETTNGSDGRGTAANFSEVEKFAFVFLEKI